MSGPTAVVALAAAAAVAAYAAIVRPWMLAWGATKGERPGPLPGDDTVTNARYGTTRAVTIDAPPDRLRSYMERDSSAGSQRAEQPPTGRSVRVG
jgi:hypothetical protein